MKLFNVLFLLKLLNLYFNVQISSQADCSSALNVYGNSKPFNPSGVCTNLEQLACGDIEHNNFWIDFHARAIDKLEIVMRSFNLAAFPTLVDLVWSLYLLSGSPGTICCNNKTQLSYNFAGYSTDFGIPGATEMFTLPFIASTFNIYQLIAHDIRL